MNESMTVIFHRRGLDYDLKAKAHEWTFERVSKYELIEWLNRNYIYKIY